jgi:hypothetical protein
LAFSAGGSGFTSNAGSFQLFDTTPLTLNTAFDNSGTFRLDAVRNGCRCGWCSMLRRSGASSALPEAAKAAAPARLCRNLLKGNRAAATVPLAQFPGCVYSADRTRAAAQPEEADKTPGIATLGSLLPF